jgi:aminoglycoside phosphotransferase (APT) family kinase protein
VIEPGSILPGGALIVDFIAGQAPRLPGELVKMAETLALIHALPLPDVHSPIARQSNPFLETLEGIELNAMRFLDKAVPDQGARAEIAEELRAMRGMALALGRRAQPLTMALADTHPGNFIVDRAGIAWFVDLEKVHVGSPAIDLAHATLPTSTLWHPDIDIALTAADVRAFNDDYLARIGTERAAALRPWLAPMRRLTWLRTTLFMARWRVETQSPHNPFDPSQWSDSGLDHKMKRHIEACIDQCFSRDFIRNVRSEWLEQAEA